MFFFDIGAIQDTFESMGQFVDGLKFTGGSHSMMPKAFIKEVISMAHKHNVYVSTGDWAEHLLRKGPSAFKEYIEVCENAVLYFRELFVLNPAINFS